MKLEELLETCPQCNGQEIYTESSGSAHVQYSRSGLCGRCEKKGLVFTETGAVLKEFVQRLRKHGFIALLDCVRTCSTAKVAESLCSLS